MTETEPLTRRLDVISVEECLQLLESRSIGRIAFVDHGRPQVRPVNYRFHEGSVVLRTAHGTWLDTVHLAAVAFEVDAIDADYHTGWSVVVHGKGEEVWRPEELAAMRRLPLRPWAPGTREHYVRIHPAEITGRRIT